MATPDEILTLAYTHADSRLEVSFIDDEAQHAQIEYICRNLQNRAGVRLLMASLLAKIHQPHIDIRKPYTEIGGTDSYSGRSYDEQFITSFINKHDLPCNPTTAFLTPALRNHNQLLSKDANIVGRPAKLYEYVLSLLDDVSNHRINPNQLLYEVIRFLLVIRNERKTRLTTLLANLKTSDSSLLSVDNVVNIIRQHLQQPQSSRLPVLVIAAIYQTLSENLQEYILPLHLHNAADEQTRALGDVEVALLHDSSIITVYEMKTRKVKKDDIDQALQKVLSKNIAIQQYIFITTITVDDDVLEYAKSIYNVTSGIEFAILDCVEFVRYILYLFHQMRIEFLDNYQTMVLAESDSGVSQPLKEVLLTLRQASESQE